MAHAWDRIGSTNVAPYVGPQGPGKVLTDLGVNGLDHTACNLAAVSWVTPDGIWSDHGGKNHGTQTGPLSAGFGPAWVADIVDAVGGIYYDSNHGQHQTPCPEYWGNTAILITWDDWGGWYDHVEPFSVLLNTQQNPCNVWGCGYVYGFRVPFLFVSAYTPQHFVSGTGTGSGNTCTDTPHCYDFGSILAFVELNFNLGNVFGQNQYADFFAKALDTQFYSLSTARSFTPIPSPVPASCFISPDTNCFSNYTGAVDPDDDAFEPSN